MEGYQIALLKKALEQWGKNSQVMMALEEMAELSKELLKNINRNKNNVVEIMEEIADVYILLEQMKIVYEISEDEINNIIGNKIKRLENEFSKNI
jgi:NTP pyrophosphatase (non-canonical NTP hydrolase)